MICTFRHALGLRSAVAGALSSDGVTFDDADVLCVLGVTAAAEIGGFNLAIDRVLVLAAGVATGSDSDLTAVVLVVRIQLVIGRGSVAEHVHVRSTVRIVLLAVVRRKLVLVLEEGVLWTLRSSGSVRDVAGDVSALASGSTTAAFARRVDLIEFGTALVHVGRAWLVLAHI